MSGRRIVSLAAQRVLVDQRSGRPADAAATFHTYVATPFANAGDAPSLAAEHGAEFAAAWAAAKSLFGQSSQRALAS